MGYRNKRISVELDLETVLDGVDFDDVLECFDTEQVMDALLEDHNDDFQEYAVRHVLPGLEGVDCVEALKPMLESLHDADPDALQELLQPYLPAPVKEEPLVTHYEVNVSRNGQHFFATAPRSLLTRQQALDAVNAFMERFPAEDGYKVTCYGKAETGREMTMAELQS